MPRDWVRCTAKPLSIDSRLLALLPTDLPSVVAFNELERETGGGGYLVVALQGPELDAVKDAANTLAPKLEALPEIRHVRYRRHGRFFRERALYYLEVTELQRLRAQIGKLVSKTRLARNPLYVDLETPSDLSSGAEYEAISSVFVREETILNWHATCIPPAKIGEWLSIPGGPHVLACLCNDALLDVFIGPVVWAKRETGEHE